MSNYRYETLAYVTTDDGDVEFYAVICMDDRDYYLQFEGAEGIKLTPPVVDMLEAIVKAVK